MKMILIMQQLLRLSLHLVLVVLRVVGVTCLQKAVAVSQERKKPLWKKFGVVLTVLLVKIRAIRYKILSGVNCFILRY